MQGAIEVTEVCVCVCVCVCMCVYIYIHTHTHTHTHTYMNAFFWLICYFVPSVLFSAFRTAYSVRFGSNGNLKGTSKDQK